MKIYNMRETERGERERELQDIVKNHLADID